MAEPNKNENYEPIVLTFSREAILKWQEEDMKRERGEDNLIDKLPNPLDINTSLEELQAEYANLKRQ